MRTGTRTARRAGAACLLAAAITTGGCGRGDQAPAGVDDALARDLASAGAAVEAHARERTRFVSPLEAGVPVPGAESAPSPRGTGRAVRPARTRARVARVASHTPARTEAAEPTRSEPVADAEVPAAPQAETVSTDDAPAPAPTTESTAHGPAPDEAPAPAAEGAGQERGRRRGGGWGRIFGGIGAVVIRGGGVGDIDHCERDAPRRRRRPGDADVGGWPLGGLPTRGGATIGGGIYPRY